MSKIVKMSKSEFQIDRESRMIELQKLKRSELIRLLAIQTIRANSAEAYYNELNHQIRYLLPILLDGKDIKTREIINQQNVEILVGLQNLLKKSDSLIAEREEKSATQSKKNVSAKGNLAKKQNYDKIKNEVEKHWLNWKANKPKFKKTDFAEAMIQLKKFTIGKRTITGSWCTEWEEKHQMSN